MLRRIRLFEHVACPNLNRACVTGTVQLESVFLELIGVLLGGFIWAVLFGLLIWLYVLLPASMAERRNRSIFIWVLISLLGSPFLAVLLLLALGDASEEQEV